MTSSGQLRKRVRVEGQTVSSKKWAWSSLRGKPSMRKRWFWPAEVCLGLFLRAADMAFERRATVISIGTMIPSLMLCLIRSPYWLPSRSCSSRSRSPAERWTKP